MTLTEEIFATLSQGNDNAAIGQFMELLRRVPGLRRWLRAAFMDSMTRQKLDAYLDGKMTPPLNRRKGRPLLDWLNGTSERARVEIEGLKQYKATPFTPTNFGGLSRAQIITLIRRYQAGRIDCAAFLILHAWWRDLVNGKEVAPATVAATGQFIAAAVGSNRPQLLRHLAQAAEFFDGHAIGTIKSSHFGHSAWWKMNLLAYMLSHPKPIYRTGELAKYLAGIKLVKDLSDIRRFCRQHGIARDTRRGRPKKNSTVQSFPISE